MSNALNNYCKGCKKLFNMIFDRCPYCDRWREDYAQSLFEMYVEIAKYKVV